MVPTRVVFRGREFGGEEGVDERRFAEARFTCMTKEFSIILDAEIN